MTNELLIALTLYTIGNIIIIALSLKSINSRRALLNQQGAYLNEREDLIDQREALYEANKKEVECIISFLIKELNKQGANHDK